ncbi:uncharacterized protein FFNC_01802 [Fusarium fujikuroi]|nr:uncharacterized protein FFNC_01802 [Fusarium fujikuroi]
MQPPKSIIRRSASRQD